MNVTTLLIVAAVAVFSVLYLVSRVPLTRRIPGFRTKTWSPRLALCKLLTPFDAIITIVLVCGAWIGFTTAVTGISMITYNALTGFGLSMGILLMRIIFIPRWQNKYQQETEKFVGKK